MSSANDSRNSDAEVDRGSADGLGSSSSSRLRSRRVQLGDLPHEIKDLVVRHCHGADHNLYRMIRHLEGLGGLPTDADCNLYDVRRTYRRTVAVLYEVSKEWRSLCAPYRFEKLLTSKVADDYFHLVIAPTHGHHVVKVEFDATAPEQILEFIKALPFLPNLRTINLTRKLLDGVRRLDAPLRRAVDERLDLIIGTGIRDLTLDRLPLNDIFRFTARAPNVTTLSLSISYPTVIAELWSIILPMPHLAKLSLTCVRTLPEALEQTTLDAMPGPLQLPNWRTLTTSRQRTPLSAGSIASFANLFARHPGVKHVLSDPLSFLVGGDASDEYPLVAMTNPDTLAERLQHDMARKQRRNTLDAIDSVLEYATEWRKRIAATEDWVDTARFVQQLGRLDLERMVHLL